MKKPGHRQWKYITVTGILAGWGTAVLGYICLFPKPLIFAGIGIFLLSLFLRLLFYRCPHCGAFLDKNRGEYCSRCGKKLTDDRKNPR